MGSDNCRSLSVNYLRLVAGLLSLGISFLPMSTWGQDYSVTTTRDNVAGSLRSALIQANADPSPARISFDLSTEDRHYDATSHTWTLFVASPLPQIEKPGLEIAGIAFEQEPHIIISGRQSSLPQDSNGLIIAAPDVTLSNIGIVDFPHNGIVITARGSREHGTELHNVLVRGSGHGERHGGRVLVSDVTRAAGVMIGPGARGVVITGSRIHDNYSSGIVLQGSDDAEISEITLHDTDITHNGGHGIWAAHVSNVIYDGRVRSDLVHTIGHNRRLNVALAQAARVTLRDVRFEYVDTTDREGNVAVEESHTVALEQITVSGGTVSGITFRDVWESIVTESTFTDLYPHAIEQYGGRMRYQGNTFRDVEESALFAGPLYGESTPFATLHLSDNAFEDVPFSVAHEYSCIASVAEAEIPGQTLHARPFLLRLSEDTAITPATLAISGAGIAPATLVRGEEGYYGYADTTLTDVRSWPRAQGADAPYGILRVRALTAEGQSYGASVEIALLDACTHDTRRNDTDALTGLPTPYTVTLAEENVGDDGGGHVVPAETPPESEEIHDVPTGAVVIEGSLAEESRQMIYSVLIFAIIVVVSVSLLGLLYVVVRAARVLRTQSDASQTIDGVRVTRRTHYISTETEKQGFLLSAWKLVSDRALFFALAQFVVSGLNYVFLILIARFGGAEALGEINALLVVLFLSAMPAVIMQDYTTYSVAGLCCTRSKRHVISRYILYSAGITLVVFGVMLAASPLLMEMSGVTSWSTMILFAGVAALNYLLPVPRGAWQAHKNFYMLGAHLLVEALIKSGSILLFLLFFEPINAVLLAIATGYTISLAWLGASLIRRHFISLKRAFIRSQTKDLFVQSGLYFLVGVILFSILYNIDLLFVQHFAREDADLYAVAARIAQLLVFGGLSISTVFLPIFREQQHSDPLTMLRRPYGFVIAGVASFFAIVLIGGDLVIALLFGPDFVAAYPLLLRTGINMACLTLAAPGMYFLLARGEHHFLVGMFVIVLGVVGVIMAFAPPLHVMIGIFGVANALFLIMIIAALVRVTHVQSRNKASN